MPAKLFAFVVIVCAVEFISARCYGWVCAFGYLDLGNLKVVLGLAGGVGAKEEAVSCVRFVFVSGEVDLVVS